MSPRETTSAAMLHEDDDDDASRMQSSVASSAATVQELTGILEDNNNNEVNDNNTKAAEAPRRASLPKKKFPSNEPRNLRRGGGGPASKSKMGATRKTLNGKLNRNRSPLRHSTGSIAPIAEDEVSNEGFQKAERRKSNDSASIGLPARADRSWQGWAEVSETSSGWSDVYQDDDDSLEDFDELDGHSLPFVDEAEGIIEKPIILDKPEMKRSQSAPQGKEEDENAKPKLRTKSSSRKLYNALNDDEIDNMNSSGFSVTAIMTGRRSHSVPPKVEVPEIPVKKPESTKEQPEKLEKKEAERKARVEKKMQDAIQSGLHDSASSLFSVSAFLKRSHSVPPKVETPDTGGNSKKASDESNNNKQASRAKQSTKKLNKSGKLQDSNSTTLSQSLKKLPKGSGHKEDGKADELAASRRDKVRGRSSNRKVTSSTKLQESQSSGLSQSSKISMPKNKERRSHSVPSQVEQPKIESLLKETPQPKPSQTSLNKLRGRSSNRKVATSSKSSKMEESQSSGMSSSSKKSLPRPDKVRRSHSVPTEVEQPPPESLLKETPPKAKKASPDKLRGRSSNRKVATSSSKPSKLDESQSSSISTASKKSQASKGKLRRSQSVPSEVEDKVALSADAETPKMANKTAGASKDKVRGQSSSRRLGGSARMQDSSSTGISVNSKKSLSQRSRRGQSVPAQKDVPNGEGQEAEKPRPSSKERTRDRSKTAKKLSSSGRLDDSYSTTASKKSLPSKESRRRSQSVPSQKDLPKAEEPGPDKPRSSSKERTRTRKLSKSGRLEDSQSTGLSLSSHKSHKSSSSKRSQSVPARKENVEPVKVEDENAELEEVRRTTPTKTKYPSRRRDSPVANRTSGRAQSLSTIRSRNTALNMFNKSTGSAQPLELSFREDETRRMVKEAGFLEASEYIGNTRSKSLGRSLYRRRDSVEQESKVYLPPNIPRDRSGRRWSLHEEVGQKASPEDDESSVGRRHSTHDSSAQAAPRTKLSKAEVQKQRRARSHSIQRRSRGDEQAFSADDSNMLSPRSIDELDKNDSGQNLFGNITISELDKIKEDASLSLTDRWETVPHAIPFPEAEFPEPEWDNSKLNASDGRISTSTRTSSASKAIREKKNRSESNLNVSRKGRIKSPKGDRSRDSAQRKRPSSQSRSTSRPQSDRSRFDDAVTSTTVAKEESTFHRSADSMIIPKNDSISGEEGSDQEAEQRPKPRTSSTRASLVALYGGTLAQGDSDHGAEKGVEKKNRRSGSLSPEMRNAKEADDLDTGLYDGHGEGELTIQSETGPRLRYVGRQFPKDRARNRESMKRDGRNRLAKERSRPLKKDEEEEWEEENDEADLANKSDGELPKSDGELSLEKSPSRDSWGTRKKASGRNPQQQQRNRRDTVSQDMLHQSVTSIPSLEPIPVEKSNPSSGVTQMQTVKEQPWQRRRRLSIGGEDQ